MSSSNFPEDNLTYKILTAAREGKYAVPAFNWYGCFGETSSHPPKSVVSLNQLLTRVSTSYNANAIMGVIKAAERTNSPAIIQLFPWTLHFQGPHFVRFVCATAKASKAPVAVHLDHCTLPEDVDLALTLPFDSIMIDASTAAHDENLAVCKRDVARANALGISVEVEMGRIEGGEVGLPTVDLEAVLTKPDEAGAFLQACGAQFLAPSFGNIHGGYGPGGAEAYWKLDL